MSHNRPCSSCISARDKYRRASAALCVLLGDGESQEETRCVNLQDGKWEREEVVGGCPVTRHSLPLSQPSWQPRTMKRLQRLPQNSSQVCLGLRTHFSRTGLCRPLLGLDNLPSEISFLLTEIQHIDIRSQGTSQNHSAVTTGISHNSSKNSSKRPPKKLRDAFVIPAVPLPVLHRIKRTRRFMRPSKNITRRSNNWPTRSSFWRKGSLISFHGHAPNWTMIYRECLFNRAKIPTLLPL
jgi:hypothetical protein